MSRLGWVSLVATALGSVLFVVGFVAAPVHALHAWLVAVLTAYTIACGALLLSLIGYATDAAWIAVVRRPLESIAGTLPIVGLLFVPILLSIGAIYPWAPGGLPLPPHAEELVRHKRAWLNEPAFLGRSIAYLVAPVVLFELFRLWSKHGRVRAPRVASAIAIPLFGLVITFAMFDWLMSLEPTFYSTSFGLIPNAGGFAAALGVLSVIVAVGGGARSVITSEHTHAIGKLMLAAVSVWAYLAFTHYLLIWIADLPIEVRWYLPRTGPWKPVASLLVVLHFAVPFAALLSRALKRRPALLAIVGALLVAMHWVDLWWQTMPAIEPAPSLGLAEVGAVLAIGGATMLVGIVRAARAPSLRASDPLFLRGLRYRSE